MCACGAALKGTALHDFDFVDSRFQNCRAVLSGPPDVVRTAISRRRVVARASCKPPTFATAVASSKMHGRVVACGCPAKLDVKPRDA
jgi:hypothetical protein